MSVDVYFYIPAASAASAVECGLKLSSWADRQITIEGEIKNCLSGLLNPRDDMKSFKDRTLKCLKLEVPKKYCFVADRTLYNKTWDESMELYQESIIPVEKYIFGTYRIPECLVLITVLSDKISLLDKLLDVPVLYDNSESLYLSNALEKYKDQYRDFNDMMLHLFFDKMVDIGNFAKIEDVNTDTSIFIENSTQKVYTIKIPGILKRRKIVNGKEYKVSNIKKPQRGRGFKRFWRKTLE